MQMQGYALALCPHDLEEEYALIAAVQDSSEEEDEHEDERVAEKERGIASRSARLVLPISITSSLSPERDLP